MPLYVGMPAFPGDPTFTSTPVRSLARGDPYNISQIALGTHAGTHVDPPVHFVAGGATTDQLDLDTLNGRCRVVDVDPRSTVVPPESVETLPAGTERVLFRTGNSGRWTEPYRFFPDYVGLAPAAADALARAGVRLVGIDALSVENDATGRFPVHHALLSRGILILEGLLLADVPAGEYLLDCLPLRLRSGDGGPARASLRAL